MATGTEARTALQDSSAGLLAGLAAQRWTDDDMLVASWCEGWTRGHVLTHLARNADGITDTLAGALRGEVVPRYPGGDPARDAAIQAGARRSAQVLVEDVVESTGRLDRALAAVAAVGGWDLPTAEGRRAADWLPARRREIEVHRVDLAGSYTPRDWPGPFVAELLADALPGLDERAGIPVRVRIAGGTDDPGADHPGADEAGALDVVGPDWAVAAWAIGRGAAVADVLPDPPTLGEWR